MFLIYDLIFILFSLIHFPYFIFKHKFHPGFLMRLGIFSKEHLEFLKDKNPIWIHAVSVGEVNAVKSLIGELRKEYPHKDLVISTVTETGNTIARSIAKDNDRVIYLPLDLSFIVKRVIDLISPSLFITVETEIWPNLISWLNKKKIPIVLVNGRISNRSFKGYRIIKFLLRNILKKLSLFCMQTDRDRERILFLGAPKDRVFVVGNMKFDTTDYTDRRITDYTDKYKTFLGLSQKEILWVAGSTHRGEEVQILDVYRDLLLEFPNLRLLIAPRHPERSYEIENLIRDFGFKTLKISRLNKENIRNGKEIFLLDTVGELLYFYSIAEIVFVGGSLIKKGGHNLIEPAFFRKPIIFGPYMFNFQDICDLFLNNKGAIMVSNKQELQKEIKNLLKNPSKRGDLGRHAENLILQNQGAAEKNIDLIKSFFEQRIQNY